MKLDKNVKIILDAKFCIVSCKSFSHANTTPLLPLTSLLIRHLQANRYARCLILTDGKHHRRLEEAGMRFPLYVSGYTVGQGKEPRDEVTSMNEEAGQRHERKKNWA
jgi:hypothetical protein